MSRWLNVARVLTLVALYMLWNASSDWLYEALHVDSFASPWKLPLILLGALVTLGGIVGLGCVVWGKASLRELGWQLDAGLTRLVALGLALTIFEVGLVFCAYAYSAGSKGVTELAAALQSIDASERIFYFVMGAKVALAEETLFVAICCAYC
jgi:hypothetical protein